MHFSHSITVFLFNPHNFCVHFYSRIFDLVISFTLSLYLYILFA